VITINVTGSEAIRKKLEGMSGLTFLHPALLLGAEHIKAKMRYYPPITEGNTPREFNTIRATGGGYRNTWYQRTLGMWTVYKDGSTSVNRTSEDLRGRWTINEETALRIIIGNDTSYGPLVQDRAQQAWFHQAHGWQTAQDVIDSEAHKVLEFVAAYIDKYLTK
jgi:hypothetical protein